MAEVKGCQHILERGVNKGEYCGKTPSIYKYCETHCSKHRNEISEDLTTFNREYNMKKETNRQNARHEKLILTSKTGRNIDVFSFENIVFSNLNPRFDKNETDVIAFVDQFLFSYLFFHPNEDYYKFIVYIEQLGDLTLEEVKKELELRGFDVEKEKDKLIVRNVLLN